MMIFSGMVGAVVSSGRCARRRACSWAKGLLSRKRDCCGTVVAKRWALLWSGLGKSNVRNRPGRFWRSMNP